MKLYDNNLIFKADLNDVIIKDTVNIKKSINEFYQLHFSVSSVFETYNDLKSKYIIEIEDDYYVIDNISKSRSNGLIKDITATHIFSELETQYWENDFEVVNPIDWEANKKIILGLFYSYDSNTYKCTETHISSDIFDSDKFIDITGAVNNYMPDTTPQLVLERLLANTDWTVKTSSSFTSTDFYLKRGSIYSNIKNIINTWGGELDLNKRDISIKTKLGVSKSDIFNYSENNIKLSISEYTDTLVNKLYIYGSNGLTIESINGGNKFLTDTASINVYGERVDEIILENITDVDFLKLRCQEELDKVKNPILGINVDVLDLNISDINLGDEIHLNDSDIGENNKTRRVYSISYNPLNRKISNYSLGGLTPNITTIFKKIKKDYKKNDDIIKDVIKNLPNNEGFISRVIDVTEEETLSANNAHLLNAWIQNLFIQRLRTNIWGKNTRNLDLQLLINQGETEAENNYIIIEDQYLKMVTETIDLTQEEALMIENPNPILENMVNVYYTAIGEDEQAYKYYTITKPSTLNNNIPIEDNELYEVKVFKTKLNYLGNPEILNKMEFDFLEGGNNEVRFKLGAGDGTTETSNTFRIFKDVDNVALTYFNSNDEENSIKLNLNNVQVVNSSLPIGGGGLANIYYGTETPNNTIGNDGDIFIKLP